VSPSQIEPTLLVCNPVPRHRQDSQLSLWEKTLLHIHARFGSLIYPWSQSLTNVPSSTTGALRKPLGHCQSDCRCHSLVSIFSKHPGSRNFNAAIPSSSLGVAGLIALGYLQSSSWPPTDYPQSQALPLQLPPGRPHSTQLKSPPRRFSMLFTRPMLLLSHIGLTRVPVSWSIHG